MSTQGRSFWILDDITPLRTLTAEVMTTVPSASVDDALAAVTAAYGLGTVAAYWVFERVLSMA